VTGDGGDGYEDGLDETLWVDLPGLRAAGLIVAGLMVAFSAPLGWAEYIRTGDDDAMGCTSNVKRQTASSASSAAGRDVEKGGACRATCLDIVGWTNKTAGRGDVER
jgi:hypothetical protein